MEFWCNKRLIITLTGPDGRREIGLQQPFARIGNHAGSEVVLGGIEKRALYLHATDEGLFCLDLRDYGSLGAASAGQWLAPGMQLSVGQYCLSASIDPAPCDPSSTSNPLTARGTAERPHPAFRITCKSGPKARYKLSRALTVVGRDVKLGLNLYGSLVSAPHCVLYSRNGRVWCVDLLSGNGTLLNGERCDRFEVLPGHQLQVGEFRLAYSGLTPQSQSSSRTGYSAEGSPPEVMFGAELVPPLAGTEDPVEETGTVRLGKGDTVTLSPEVPARPGGNVEGAPPAPASLPEQRSPPEAAPPVAETAGSTNHSTAKAAEQDLHWSQLSRDVHTLQKMWEEQQTQLLDLRQALTISREGWQTETNDLRNQSKGQARQILRLEAELAAARSMLAQQVLRDAAASAVIPVEDPTDACPQPAGEADRAGRETVATLDSVLPTVSWNVEKIDAAEKVNDRDAPEDSIPPLLDCKPKMKLS
jgi:hypothetical protein